MSNETACAVAAALLFAAAAIVAVVWLGRR
jgi:hypothetical protein